MGADRIELMNRVLNFQKANGGAVQVAASQTKFSSPIITSRNHQSILFGTSESTNVLMK
jgi:hypothetical protein